MKFLGIAAVVTVTAVGASAYTYVNAQSGDPNMGRNAINFGVRQTMGVYGEAAEVPAAFIEEVKPGLKALASQGGGFLGGAADATAGWDDPTAPDPATTAPQQ